jgi:hypothetical protein
MFLYSDFNAGAGLLLNPDLVVKISREAFRRPNTPSRIGKFQG